MKNAWRFFLETLRVSLTGSKKYYLWVGFLLFCIFVGALAYVHQLKNGLIVTAMRDEVSWGFYISNFTFLVGVAAAAVLLVIPAYIYNFKPIKEIAVLGELLAVSAMVMCLVFVTVDIGRPDRFWHLIPKLGMLHFPTSLLSWDVIVLNGYLIINLCIAVYILYKMYHNEEPNKNVYWPLILISIPWAVSIHTVTAFLYNGLAARPFWNASILAPRFLASAFCSGPAFMLIIFQIVRKVSNIEISDKAIFKVAELIAYSMFINLFLLGAEWFKEYYSDTVHIASMKYLYEGLKGHSALVPWIWAATIFNVIAFFLFLIPKTRENFLTLNIGCVLIFIGVYIEKGMGLVVPGFTPDVLGEIYEYSPTNTELLVSLGVWALGLLVYTLLLKVAIPIQTGEFRVDKVARREVPEGEQVPAS
ncbi:MAG: polysulfide reductase [Deltaproteobacteria bacterium]|nr:MAG: polysulfide reductase [Deltaproteobacteria bacterium]